MLSKVAKLKSLKAKIWSAVVVILLALLILMTTGKTWRVLFDKSSKRLSEIIGWLFCFVLPTNIKKLVLGTDLRARSFWVSLPSEKFISLKQVLASLRILQADSLEVSSW